MTKPLPSSEVTMINMDKKGPEVITITKQTKTVCDNCKYFNRAMTKSGLRPQYMSRCTNPEVGKKEGCFHVGIIDRYNGSSDTPRWCPFLIKDKTPTENFQ